MIARLLLIEWLKARRRKAFWLALLACPLTATLMMLPAYMVRRSRPEMPGMPMPESWPTILNFAAGAGGVILASALAIMVASESGWRTQRQNVIDGLSRTEYVAGKFLFAIAFVSTTWVLMLCLTTVLGHLNFGIDATTWAPFAEPVHLLMMGGVLLYILMMAAAGTFFGLLVGSGGAALGTTVIFIIAQTGLLIPILMVNGGGWLEVIPYLPARVGNSLRTAETYNGAQLAEMVEGSMFGSLSAGAATLVAVAYIALFVWGGWAAIRYRDL